MPNWPRGTFLNRLPERARKSVLTLGSRVSLPPHHVMLRQGEYGGTVWILLDATTKVTAVQNDAQALLAIRVSGDVLGEMGAMDGSPRSATVTTCGRAIAYRIKGPVFAEFLRREPPAALTLGRMMAERLRWANQRRLDFTGYKAEICLARVLIALAERHGRTGPGGIQLGVPLTHAELGGMVGAKEVTVQKALRRLAALGLIQRFRGRVVITDFTELAAYADLNGEKFTPNPY